MSTLTGHELWLWMDEILFERKCTVAALSLPKKEVCRPLALVNDVVLSFFRRWVGLDKLTFRLHTEIIFASH